jgi:hypothetical protein
MMGSAALTYPDDAGGRFRAFCGDLRGRGERRRGDRGLGDRRFWELNYFAFRMGPHVLLPVRTMVGAMNGRPESLFRSWLQAAPEDGSACALRIVVLLISVGGHDLPAVAGVDAHALHQRNRV